MSKKRHRTLVVYPCKVYSLSPEANAREFERGFRFRVHDFDDQIWYFVTEERMRFVLTIHNMMPVLPEKLDELRAAGIRNQPFTPPPRPRKR
jgi:hypothetical protein